MDLLRLVANVHLTIGFASHYIYNRRSYGAAIGIHTALKKGRSMAKAEMDMVRDILDWGMNDSQKLSLIRLVLTVEKAAERPAAPAAAAEAPQARKEKKARKTKKAGRARKPSRQIRRAVLWAELKKVAPEKAAGVRYGALSADRIQEILDAVTK